MAKAHAGAVDQQLLDDMTRAEVSTTVLDNGSISPESQARSVQLYFITIMLCTGGALDRIANAPHGWCMEGWRLLFQAYSPKNNARLVVMMLEVLSFPLGDQGVREARERRHSGASQGRHRDSPDGRGTDENAPHHERAQVDDVLGHQGRGNECEASPEYGDDEGKRSDGRRLVLIRIAHRSFQ